MLCYDTSHNVCIGLASLISIREEEWVKCISRSISRFMNTLGVHCSGCSIIVILMWHREYYGLLIHLGIAIVTTVACFAIMPHCSCPILIIPWIFCYTVWAARLAFIWSCYELIAIAWDVLWHKVLKRERRAHLLIDIVQMTLDCLQMYQGPFQQRLQQIFQINNFD